MENYLDGSLYSFKCVLKWLQLLIIDGIYLEWLQFFIFVQIAIMIVQRINLSL